MQGPTGDGLFFFDEADVVLSRITRLADRPCQVQAVPEEAEQRGFNQATEID